MFYPCEAGTGPLVLGKILLFKAKIIVKKKTTIITNGININFKIWIVVGKL